MLKDNAGDIRGVGLIPELGRSPEGGHGNPILAWRVPSTKEPGRLSPWGHKESDTTEVSWHAHMLSTYLSKAINKEKDKRGKRRKEVGRHTL